MAVPVQKTLLKILKISGIVLVSIILIIFLLPTLFPQTVTKKIQGWANANINGNVTFSNTGLSFFKRFPALTLTLYDVNLKGSAPFQNQTLVAAKEVSLGIDLSSLFESKINIDKIYLNNAFINIQVDSSGKANYNIYKSAEEKQNAPADTNAASLGIKQILIEKSKLVYNDESLPMKINATGVYYLGSGDLSKDIFDLRTHTEIQSVDFYYGNKPYIIGKKVNADLLTKINTKSLAFIFQKNDLHINQLPVQFKGRFEFLKDGYNMDFKIDSHDANLTDMFTALPAEYQKMLAQTSVKGIGNLKVELNGKYIAKDKIAPNLSVNFKVRNGTVANPKAPSPIKNLYLNFETKLPGLDPDSLSVNVDSVYFNIDKDYFSSIVRVKGITNPEIYAKINTEIDLEKWDKAFGVKPIDVKGRYTLHLLAEGKYATGIRSTKTLRKTKIDTVITSVPKFTVKSSFRNGYFKYASQPEALSNINFDLDANCPDNNYKHMSMAMDNINSTMLDNYIKGYFRLANAADFPIDAQLKTKFHLADVKKFYPIDSLGVSLKGDLDVDVTSKGNYVPAKKLFPKTVANFKLADGSIQTKYYPHPIEKVNVNTNVVNTTGTVAGTKVIVKPISFEFEGEPFMLKASLHNFNNLEYNIFSKGTINIGKIYQVFAIKGYNVNGTIAANVSLKGKQSDALAGRYDQLSNKGTLRVNNVALTSELFPKPFMISKGVFSFNQDKMNFDSFTAKYGRSQIVLKGAVSNVIDYALKPNGVLKGDFNFTSDLLIADDFMAFASAPGEVKTSGPSGVIMIPKNLNLNFTADVKTVKYNGLIIKDAKGQMTINNGNLSLKQTGFNLIGAPISMDATYTSSSPQKAYFNYHINAKDFDIKKAYNQIKLFHDMATAAGNAEGLVSLDYQLSGRLNANMQPVYPSLKGGGVLSAKQLKMKGFKLFNAMGKSTGKDSIGKNSDVSKVELKTTIANNIITIERTKMRMAGFRARLEGQVGLDKSLNLKFRLGLPPLGIIGIPMNITGTQDKPKIKLGNGKKEDELQGTADDN
jgi:AsmA protein